MSELEEKRQYLAAPGVVVGVAERGEEDLDADLAGLRRRHLHVLDHERLVRLVRHRRCTHRPAMNLPRQIKSNAVYEHHNHHHHQQETSTTTDAKKLEKTRSRRLPLQVMTWPWVGEAIASWGSRGLGGRCDGTEQWRGAGEDDVAVTL